MAEVTNYDIIHIEDMMSRIETYRYNPALMQRVIMDVLEEITNGRVDVVDPTNPFIFLMESSVVNTSALMSNLYLNLRKQYPSLAQNLSDLYHHMSDKDYIGIFANPSECTFTLAIPLDDLRKAPIDSSVGTGANHLRIPRDTRVVVDSVEYTFTYPIDIYRYSNGFIKVEYDATISNPLDNLEGTLINYVVRKDYDNREWIFFDIPLKQMSLSSTQYPIEKNGSIEVDLTLPDQFMACRVYFKGDNTSNQWVEISVTHSDLVYDPNSVTALLTLSDSAVNIKIPSIYITKGLISGTLRVDLYTTKGEYTQDYSNYTISDFTIYPRSVTPDTANTTYIDAFSNSSYLLYTDRTTSGGSNGYSYAVLRDRVIQNAIGERKIPISNAQLESIAEDDGFKIIKNVDMVTNRIFLASRKLPTPVNRLAVTPATIGIGSVIISEDQLAANSNIQNNFRSWTIKSNTLFRNNNGIITLVTDEEKDALNALPISDYVDALNERRYFYTPFYYVYDQTDPDEYYLRAYDLDQPKLNYMSFMDQNTSLDLAVNTSEISIVKTDTGYRILITTISGEYFKQLADSEVALQLAYEAANEERRAYINATLEGRTESGERIYSIDLNTTEEIDRDDYIKITNAMVASATAVDTKCKLTQDFYLVYSTTNLTADYQKSSIDDWVGLHALSSQTRAAMTLERINLTLGYSLDHLWTRIRPYFTDVVYKRYETDVPLYYQNTVYQKDPVTGSIFTRDPETGNIVYNILHNAGDPVVDENGNPVYAHRAGDVVLDENGNPVIDTNVSLISEFDILMVDARYLFSNASLYSSYRKDIASTIRTWCRENLASIQNQLLEQTKIFFYPSTPFNNITVLVNRDRIRQLHSELYFTIKYFIPATVTLTSDLKTTVFQETTSLLDSYLDNTTISVDRITELLRDQFKDIVESVQVTGINNDPDLFHLEIQDDNRKFSLGKVVELDPDGTTYIKENVEIIYIQP